MSYPMWLLSSGQGCYGYAVPGFPGTVWAYQSNLQSKVTPRYFICETIFIPLSIIVGWLLSTSLSLVSIGISRFVFGNFQSVHFTPVVYGLEWFALF